MRIKLITLILMLASLARTANGSVLSPTITPSAEAIPTTAAQSQPQISTLPLEGLPNVIPADISLPKPGERSPVMPADMLRYTRQRMVDRHGF